MLIRLVEYNFNDPEDESGMINPKFIAAYDEKNFDKLMNFIKNSKGIDIVVGDDWYTIDTYVFHFPKDSDSIPSINIYVYGY